jgi:hypothetical protein
MIIGKRMFKKVSAVGPNYISSEHIFLCRQAIIDMPVHWFLPDNLMNTNWLISMKDRKVLLLIKITIAL